MTVHEIKQRVEAYVEAMNAPDFVERLRPFFRTRDAHENAMAWLTAFREAFPDYRFTIEKLVVEGNQVMLLGHVKATHMGEYPAAELKGIAPTFKTLKWREMWAARVENGFFSDAEILVDGVSRLQQMGVMPVPESMVP